MNETSHLYLTGFRGTGKTSVGRILAPALGRPLVDLDEIISSSAGKSIREIFDSGGESLFRDLETTALKKVAQTSSSVISLGGGAILRDENAAVIRQSGVCFWLDCDAETIAQRLAQDAATLEQRPSLTGLGELEEIREMLKQRHSRYEQTSDHRVDTNQRSIEQVAESILGILAAE